MKQTIPILLTISAAATTLAHGADTKATSAHTFSGNASLVSQYVFRGITQTNGKPAVQAGLDYSHKSGFYAGFWASNISWYTDTVGNASASSTCLETDAFLGYRGGISQNLSLDIGLFEAYYPGTYSTEAVKPHTTEAYAAISYKTFTVKYNHAVSRDAAGVADAKHSRYYEAGASFVLPRGITLAIHAGRQKYSTLSHALSYNDYRIAISKALMRECTISATCTYATTKDAYYTNAFGRDTGGRQVALGITKGF
ncbi:TorF family putative porin [Holophaga foetida]|uniref:TorF family putative porin n=1 Tax=Holophaga foetida TaxID=35839 RepID=UPI0002471C88|nr:TorF family putative porin [Holophaga foetida]